MKMKEIFQEFAKDGKVVEIFIVHPGGKISGKPHKILEDYMEFEMYHEGPTRVRPFQQPIMRSISLNHIVAWKVILEEEIDPKS